MANKGMKRCSTCSLLKKFKSKLNARNANQNYNEIPLHTSQNGQHQKVYKLYMPERVWRKGNTLVLLVGMQIDTATMEDGMEIP